MSLNTFFLDSQILSDIDDASFSLDLSDEDMRHAGVLRLSPGEKIAVVDAGSDYFICEICSITKGNMTVRIASREEDAAYDRCRRLPSFTLFQGFPKSDKFETIVRQGTEIGIDGFVPFVSERTVPRLDSAKAARKRDRWLRVAKSAAMQSGRRSVPRIEALTRFEELPALLRGFDRIIVYWEEARCSGDNESPVEYPASEPHDIAIVVGPEGGISESEVGILMGSSDKACLRTLGGTILRTETAAIVGSALAISEYGGLGASCNSGSGDRG